MEPTTLIIAITAAVNLLVVLGMVVSGIVRRQSKR